MIKPVAVPVMAFRCATVIRGGKKPWVVERSSNSAEDSIAGVCAKREKPMPKTKKTKRACLKSCSGVFITGLVSGVYFFGVFSVLR